MSSTDVTDKNFHLGPHPVPGDPIPGFTVPILGGRADFGSDKLAGRHCLLLFLGSAGHADCAAALASVDRHQALFDDRIACFFAVTVDRADVEAGRVADHSPGRHVLLDFDRQLSFRHGALARGETGSDYRPHWLLLDPAQRVIGRFPLAKGEQALHATARSIAAPQPEIGAPVLAVPYVLELDYCRALIAYYDDHGGTESGFMRQSGGKTYGVNDASVKRRLDCAITDEGLQNVLRNRIARRLAPAIQRAFQSEVSRVERYIVARYDGDSAGFFSAHRDNTTSATAHRRFAVTINLNDDFDGGELCFPEFGRRSYRVPAGHAIVFSCGLLHEALPVRRGLRYATLPFLYDEAAAVIREANEASLLGDAEPMSMAAA